MSAVADWASGYRVLGGPGPTVVDLEELTFACRLLEGAADRLDAAAWSLGLASRTCSVTPVGAEARRALTDAREASSSPGRVADHLRELAAALCRVVEVYTEAESMAHLALRVGVVTTASQLGEQPVAAGLLGAAGVVLGVAAVGSVLAGSVGRALLLRRPDPVLPWLARRLGPAARETPGMLTADGRAELGILAAGAFVRSAAPGRQIPRLRPVQDAAGLLSGLLPPAGPTALLVRARPPQLPVPRTTAGVLANVGRSYQDGTETGLAGTPTGVISVQQLTHPDGTRAWIVEIPGTESWLPNDVTPLDLTTDLRLLAALSDDVTDAVLDSMRRAGIRADEPVMLAGHSLGGMVAVSVAAAVGSTYTVRAIATAGSPDLPRSAPAGVEVRHYRHTGDAVPQLDGTPDTTAGRVTVVTRDLDVTGGPPVPDPVGAHAIARYVETADVADRELAGSPGLRAFDAAVADVLGPPGTTGVTRQFQATRDPALVAAQPPRVWPSS
ncbi:hypothetical protein HP550_18665 [Cellulomonas humilata]|uniref:Fungal lipase-like domain-containing protein n=1 Tax=Cellulomonas humilata TaxID=144055 RepID=A0A7Y6A5Y8_9CELL|nr:hypothetical protein [Cellulomonas humilata]NUU19277.1 hypothetical protein [Cellulomonas humilata]